MWCIIVSKFDGGSTMNKRVEEFLADSESRLDRNQILIEAGLYDKIYMPETDDGNSCNGESLRCDYPESEYDEEKGRTVYYRKQAIKVTNEEYKAILKSSLCEKNSLANFILWIALIILVGGAIAGLLMGSIIILLIGVAITISLLWFAEVLRLLQDIKNRLNRK